MKQLTESYTEYIRSEKWKRTRARFIKSRYGDGPTQCFRCQKFGPIEVHHKHYKRFRRELLKDLVGLCDECHKFIHKQKDSGKKTKWVGDGLDSMVQTSCTTRRQLREVAYQLFIRGLTCTPSGFEKIGLPFPEMRQLRVIGGRLNVFYLRKRKAEIRQRATSVHQELDEMMDTAIGIPP